MIEEVHDAIDDLVELVKTYQSKNKISQLLMSTLFKRRQDEMGAVVDRAISSLQVSRIYKYVWHVFFNSKNNKRRSSGWYLYDMRAPR